MGEEDIECLKQEYESEKYPARASLYSIFNSPTIKGLLCFAVQVTAIFCS